jgi:hypothetical protein
VERRSRLVPWEEGAWFSSACAAGARASVIWTLKVHKEKEEKKRLLG